MTDRPIAVLVGSLRGASLTLKLAKAMVALAPDGFAFRFVPIGDLPLYNEELEAEVPTSWRTFRDTIAACDGVLIFTPEYNRGVPGGLKNALDVGSRPNGQNVFAKKPTAVVSQSPGAMGGFGANHAVRQSLVFLDMPTMQQPEAYIGHTGTMFTDDGSVEDAKTRDFLASVMRGYADWFAHFQTPA